MAIKDYPPVPAGIERPPEGATGYYDRSTPEQRREVKEICGLLRSDLYDRTGSNDEDTSAVWTSPLGWAVEYGNMRNGNVWVRIYKPDGTLYRETLDGTVEWVHAELP